jgi:hypothetical protein
MSEAERGTRSPTSDELEAWIAASARESYRVPEQVPRDRLWQSIEAARDNAKPVDVIPLRPRRPAWAMRVAALAAAVLVGVGIARVADRSREEPGDSRQVAQELSPSDAVLLAAVASHLERSEAVLTAARLDAREASPRTDTEVVTWARDLLTTTRLLRDARAQRDPRMRVLLDDLELALAQLVQFQRSGRSRDAVALRETLADSDLLTRLRGVSATPVLSRDDSPRTE